MKIDYSCYLVTDEACLNGKDLCEAVREALEGGVTMVQYRAKNTDGGTMYDVGKKLKAICDEFSVPLIVNDRVDVALSIGAAGVHLGQSDLPCKAARELARSYGFIIGVSAHNLEEANQALMDGATYLGCGAVFGSSTKTDAGYLGLDGLKAICDDVYLPIVGIGGVNASNYADVIKAGASGGAIVSGILGAENIKEAAREICHIKDEL
ncbi:MAG: thiamine phosphate synthase [Phascolarctobacterium sp.]|nr:thiamine phosphate synthase [Phascolarctobacterium sp.]